MSWNVRVMMFVFLGDGLANTLLVFAIFGPVGELARGRRREALAVAGTTAERTLATIAEAWLAYFLRALSDATWSTVTATAAPPELGR